MGRYFWLSDEGLFQALEPVEVSTGSSSAGRLVKLASDGKFDPSVLRFFNSSIACGPPILPASGMAINWCPMAVIANQNAYTSFSLGSMIIYWYPFFIWRDVTITECAVNVTNIGSGTHYVGIYNSQQDFYPSTLLTSGSYIAITTGYKSIPMSPVITLRPGVYWLALKSEYSHGIAGLNHTGVRSFGFRANLIDSTHVTYWATSTTHTTLPPQAPTSGYTVFTGNIFIVAIKITT